MIRLLIMLAVVALTFWCIYYGLAVKGSRQEVLSVWKQISVSFLVAIVIVVFIMLFMHFLGGVHYDR
jgi:hypothetical protein